MTWTWDEYVDDDSRPAYTAKRGNWELHVYEAAWPPDGNYRWEVRCVGDKTGMHLWGVSMDSEFARTVAESYAEVLALEVETFLLMGVACIKEVK